jgi:hypothetical protein
MKNRPHKFKKGVFAVRPPEAMQLFEVLVRIFPAFEQTAVIEDIQESENGLHCVMSLFTVYLGANRGSFSDGAFRNLGNLINEAVSLDDVLENAVSTCLLEHLGQIRAYKLLSPYLSKKAKARTYA